MDPQPPPHGPDSAGIYGPVPRPQGSERPGYNAVPPPGTSSTLPYRPSPAGNPISYPQPTGASDRPASYAPAAQPPSTTGTYSAPPSYYNNPPPRNDNNTNQNHSYNSHDGNPNLTYAPPLPIPEPYSPDDGTKPRPPRPLPATGATGQAPAPTVSFPPPPTTTSLAPNHTQSQSLTSARDSTASALRELISLRRAAVRRQAASVLGSVNGIGLAGQTPAEQDANERVRAQTGVVLASLRELAGVVADVRGAAEAGRWRRWGVGAVIASVVPLVKRLFRRRRHDDSDDGSANRTEYAFRKSKGLISRILASTRRPGLGTIAFFVFAVLYVFQNEVSLRVARTVSKRLRRLAFKVEAGGEELTEDDVKLLQGWRWRVLAWSE